MYLVQINKKKERKRSGQKQIVDKTSYKKFDTKTEAMVFVSWLLKTYPQISKWGYKTEIESTKIYKEMDL
jgi:hypothetical protein